MLPAPIPSCRKVQLWAAETKLARTVAELSSHPLFVLPLCPLKLCEQLQTELNSTGCPLVHHPHKLSLQTWIYQGKLVLRSVLALTFGTVSFSKAKESLPQPEQHSPYQCRSRTSSQFLA